MAPDRDDVQEMVGALFTLIGSLDRARRQRSDASTLGVLQVIAGKEGIRPSEIADTQSVHPSHATRQIRELEETGLVAVRPDADDRRSLLVSLTPAGRQEMVRLQAVGVDRFALFVEDWDASEVRTLTSLLVRLQAGASNARASAAGASRSRSSARRRRLDEDVKGDG
jgi:DNA-binding MarR family transcriptional regulator